MVSVKPKPAYNKKKMNYLRERLLVDIEITEERIATNGDNLPRVVEESKDFEIAERTELIKQHCRKNDDDVQHLADVKAALERWREGTYGWCQDTECGVRIPLARIDAIPRAKYCVSCQVKKK
ncbi:MAG: TraR/DksA family transcriptional regulator [Candidatus Nealsonbacteria bacterium]